MNKTKEYDHSWCGLTALQQNNPDNIEKSVDLIRKLLRGISYGVERAPEIPGLWLFNEIKQASPHDIYRYDALSELRRMDERIRLSEDAMRLGLIIVGQRLITNEELDSILPAVITELQPAQKRPPIEYETPAKILELRR